MEKLKAGRQTISQRTLKRDLLSIAFVIALAVMASPRVQAQVECLGACEEQFATCLANQNPNSISPACQDAYEACVDACLGGSAGVLS